MLFRSFGRYEDQSLQSPLYEVVTPDGTRISPTCEDGHVFAMEVVALLSSGERMRPRGARLARRGSADRGFMLACSGSEVLPILMPAVQPSLRPLLPAPSAEPAPLVVSPVVAAPVGLPAPNTDVIPSGKPADTPPTGDLLSTLIERHLKNVSLGPKRATPATRDRGYALNLLIEAVGDRPIATITPDDALQFATLLACWPAQRHTYRHLDGLTAPAVAARAKREKLKLIRPGTQFKHLSHVNALMNWVVKLGALKENPFKYVDTSRYLRDENGRRRKKKDTFNHADLGEIFDSTRMAGYDCPHKFWVPLIAHHTGMRVNEVSQLFLADVRTDPYLDESGQECQVMTFDITGDREGQSVKTDYSVRRIPVPQRILDLGFKRYLADVRASGANHLFPGLPWAEGGPGKTVSQWFNDTLLRKVCRITDRRKTLHSLRHTLTTLMDRNKVPESIICAINGHSVGDSVDKRNYVADGTVLEMRRVLDTLPFPDLPLAPYVSAKFSGYLAHAASERLREACAKEEGTEFKRKMGRRLKAPLPG